MKITVIGCGRWGSCIAWYLDKIGHNVTVYSKMDNNNTISLFNTRTNGIVTFPESVKLETSIDVALDSPDVIVISINSQGLRSLIKEINEKGVKNTIFVLCMKGIEIETGERLSEIASKGLDESNRVAVWLGPGHPQEFCAGIPNCMVIDSADENVKNKLVNEFSSDLIRAMKTAETAIPGCVYETTPLLREIHLGSLAHKPFLPPDSEERKLTLDGFTAFGGESNAEFRARATEFLDKVKSLDCDTVAAFTHAGILRTTLSMLFSANVNTTNFVCSNCCIVILELKNGRWMLSGLINPQ